MKKRIFAVILAGLMATCALAACSSSEETTESSGTIVLNSDDESSKEESKEESKDESKTESKTESKAESSKETEKESAPESSEESEESEEESETEESEESEEESSEPEEDSKEDSVPVEQSSEVVIPSVGFSEADMSFVYNNAYIAPNDNMSEVIAKIGKASSVQSAPSCIGVGEDKIYNYGSFTIESYPAPEGEKVLNIMLTGSDVSTSKGVTVGMSAADVKEIYGEPAQGDDYFMSYQAGDKLHLDLIMDGTGVMEIDYVYNVG